VAQRHRRARFLAAFAGPLVGLGLFGVGLALAADHAVAISGFSFSPRTIAVAVGDSVTWTNSDAQAHTATADDGSFDTGTIGNGASQTVTFATAGTFAYHCSIHEAMTATVTVQAAAAATTPPSDTEPLANPGSLPPPVGAALVMLVGGLVGLVVARRRFGRD
jgi:plastocyanin